MATYQIPAPQPMVVTGDVSTNWKDFRAAWDYYVIATELNEKDNNIQAATLCSVMGLDCVKIMNSLDTLTARDKTDPDRILRELGNHFMPQKHLLFERVKFGYANQTEHETIDQYVLRLRQLAETCEFAGLRESLLRDRIVMGTHDASTRDRLLRERPVPNLQRCIEALRASELSKCHREQLTNAAVNVANESNTVHAFSKQKGRNQNTKKQPNKANTKGNIKQYSHFICRYCGQNHKKGKDFCPAYGHTCGKCGKNNHFPSQCKSKSQRRKVHQADICATDSDSEGSLFAINRVGAVLGKTKSSDFMISLTFHTNNPLMKTVQLDSGATCSAMSLSDLKNILQKEKVKLNKSAGKIKLYDGRVIVPLGTYTLCVSYNKGTRHNITFDILDSAPWPIIDGNTCIKSGWLNLAVNRTVNMNSKYSKSEPLSKERILSDYNDVFTGLGCLPGEYHIETDPTVRPVQHAPRRVPVHLKSALKSKISEMEKQGIIAKVDTPTDWISSLVAIQKGDKLRVCIDPRDLNKAIKRPKYQMPTVDEILPKLAKAKVFSLLDAKDGFYQVKLDEESSYLTTFWTPFGRYRYLRLGQGICSAPEEFQRRQIEALCGLDGVEVIVDDVLCYGSGDTEEEAVLDHDRNLIALLDRCRQKNLKMNKQKFRLRQTELLYMGQVLTSKGLKPDPTKVSAIQHMPVPEDKKAVQRLLGCVNYLSRFMPQISDVCEPLRRLTEKQAVFVWESEQAEAFRKVTELISTAPLLKYYDVNCEATVQCDASETGLGATLLQNGQPVAFASRSLTPAERRYAQIEKECLAILFACVRFDQYLHGRDLISVQTDHKPLVPIFLKSIHSAPKRLQRMLLRLQKYSLQVNYLPGSKMYIADMLSRAYQTGQKSTDENIPQYQIFQLNREEQLFREVAEINQLDYMHLSTETHQQIKSCTSADVTLQTLMNTVMTGWPDCRDHVPVCIREYWNFKDELTAQNGVLYKGMKVIIPNSMRSQMIARVHSSHLGSDACVRRARDVLFWPGMSGEIRDKVKSCGICCEFQAKQQKEPLMTHKIPTLPWSKVGQDLFTLHGENYLVTVDYYSDYFELDHLPDTTATTVISATKSHFARHGIADMVTDNGPQYISSEFSNFVHAWEFTHTTSSPYHSQSNGKAESAVKIAKRLVKKAKRDNSDIQLALLEWRNTPGNDGSSLVQKLMSRRTKSIIPTAEGLLTPQTIPNVKGNIQMKRQKAKASYDRSAKPLPELHVGDPVRLQPADPKIPWQQGSCVANIGNRSYLIESGGKVYRRNRKFIRFDNSSCSVPSKENAVAQYNQPFQFQSPPNACSMDDEKIVKNSSDVTSKQPVTSPSPITTRSGRQTVKPVKFRDYVT